DESGETAVAGSSPDDPAGQRSFFLSSLRGPTPRGSTALTSGLAAAIPPVDVYIGPTRGSVAPNMAYAPAAPAARKKPEATAAKPPAAKPPAAKIAEKPAEKPAAKTAEKPAAKTAEKPADKPAAKP